MKTARAESPGRQKQAGSYFLPPDLPPEDLLPPEPDLPPPEDFPPVDALAILFSPDDRIRSIGHRKS